MNTPYITTISKSKHETDEIKTISFKYPGSMDPGQFFMIWIPGVDEIPMSVSSIDATMKSITFRKVGDATTALYSMNVGDKIGIRGPYGNGFKIRGKHILFVGGGTGIAMLAPAVERAVKKGIAGTVIIGARTKQELFFQNKLEDIGATVYVTTDDGSAGFKGYASDYAAQMLKKEKISAVLTCGPENMMKKLFTICQNIPFQASLERYIKCGIGICGSCCLDKGVRVCTEGPVFDEKMLKTMHDFGIYTREASGKKVYMQDKD